MIYKISSTNSGGISKIRNSALIFIFSILFSSHLFAAPIPSGQTGGAQASRFMAESQKKAIKYRKQNFDKKTKAGPYIEFKGDESGTVQSSDKDLEKNAED